MLAAGGDDIVRHKIHQEFLPLEAIDEGHLSPAHVLLIRQSVAQQHH